MEHEGTLPYSQKPVTRPEPDQLSSYPHPTSWRFVLVLSSHISLRLQVECVPQASPPKLCTYTPLLAPYEMHAPLISFFLIWSPE